MLKSGAIKVAGKKGTPNGGIILAWKKQIMEEIDEREDFVTKELLVSKVWIKGQECKITVTYTREKRAGNWKKIESWSEAKPNFKVLTGGDFKARKGQKGEWMEERNSKGLTKK